MEVNVRRSARRKKTVEARVIDGVLEIAMPAHLSADEERHWIRVMEERFERRHRTEEIDLARRAARLAERFGYQKPDRIVWSDRQRTMWGSCTPARGAVRISSRVADFPSWVLDYVIVHELAHLDVPNHSTAFWRLVNRYPDANKARGYLEAKSDGR